MALKSLTVLLAFAVSIAAFGSAADAASKRHKRAAEQPAVRQHPAYRQELPRMIELRPGYWISTWGCFSDEGYGLYNSCDMREGPM